MPLCAAGDEQQQLLLDVDASGVSSALQWLNRYKLRRKVTLEDVSSRVAVWAAFDGEVKAGPAGAGTLGAIAVQAWVWLRLRFGSVCTFAGAQRLPVNWRRQVWASDSRR
jgi:folate-binding Fe-S cluster repair protein YgfZ